MKTALLFLAAIDLFRRLIQRMGVYRISAGVLVYGGALVCFRQYLEQKKPLSHWFFELIGMLLFAAVVILSGLLLRLRWSNKAAFEEYRTVGTCRDVLRANDRVWKEMENYYPYV